MKKEEVQKILDKLRRSVEHREQQLYNVKLAWLRGDAEDREMTHAECALDMAEENLFIFKQDVAIPLGIV